MIRPARQGDAEAIAAIWNDVIRDTLATFTTVEKTSAEMQTLVQTSPCLVLEQDGQVAGFATYAPFRSGPGYRYAQEHSIFVRPECCGQGQGAALLRAMSDLATQNGVKHLIGAISGANPGAVRFHARHGFAQVGHLPKVGYKQGQWLDLILMQKQLGT